MGPLSRSGSLPEGKCRLRGADASARGRLPVSPAPAPPEGRAGSVDSAHPKVSQLRVRPDLQPDAAADPEGSAAAEQTRLEARRLPYASFRPVLAARRRRGPVSWLLLLRRSGSEASTTVAPKSIVWRLQRSARPEGPGPHCAVPVAPKGPCPIRPGVVAACLPKGAGGLDALPGVAPGLPASRRGRVASVRCRRQPTPEGFVCQSPTSGTRGRFRLASR